MKDNETAKKVLQRLLVARQPELGARLKQRMIAEYTREGIGRFDEQSLGYKKFKDYLLSVHGGLVELTQGSTQGDFEIRLRESTPQVSQETGKPQRAEESEQPQAVGQKIRSAVWTAFANPDPNRERYFHKSTGAVLHFLSGAPEKSQHALEGNDYVRIEPLSSATHKDWMREFIDALDEPGDCHALIRDREYTSALNSEFTKLLGSEADAWRRFRTERIVGSILSWADTRGISRDLIFNRSQAQPTEKSAPKKSSLTARARAIHLLDALDEDTINQSVIPLLVSSILLTRK